MTDASCFFQNTACPYFPCHKGISLDEFNCLFCYCPLYSLGADCGGTYKLTEKGIKSCVDCGFPHKRENYTLVLKKITLVLARTSQNMETPYKPI